MDDLTVFERRFAAALQDYARSEETINHVTIAHRAATQGSLRRLSGPWQPSLAIGLAALTMVVAFGIVIALLGGTNGPANPMPSTSSESPTTTPTAGSTQTARQTATDTARPTLPSLSMPGSRPGPAGQYGLTLRPGQTAQMHNAPESSELVIGFRVASGCLSTSGNPEPEPVVIGDLEGVLIEPYEPAFYFGFPAGDEITRAYALDVGNATLCVFMSWHPTVTEEDISLMEATVQSLLAEELADGSVRMVFDLSDGWDTG